MINNLICSMLSPLVVLVLLVTSIGSANAQTLESLITPYVIESDMASIQQIFNSNPDLNASDFSLRYLHDGLDIYPAGNLKPFRAACSGKIRWVLVFDENVNVMLDCDSTYTLEYNFEPQSGNTGQTQLENILVVKGQSVSQGDVIGSLYVANALAHVHFAVLKNWVNRCPEPYFDLASSSSVLKLVKIRFLASGMCHGDEITPPTLLSPNVNESDMASINEAYSTEGSTSPWGFVHDGIDFFPNGNLKPFRSACSGTVDLLQMLQNSATSNWQVNLRIVCNPYVSNTEGYFLSIAIEYVFEPMSTLQLDGQTQLSNITIANGQVISRGDVIGSLLTVGTGAHVHFSTIPFGSMLTSGVPRIPSCPEPHFSAEAKVSSLNLLHVVWPGAVLCYGLEQSTSTVLNLVPSWNLVGNSVNAPLTVATAFGDTTKVISVWKWIPATSKWAFYTPLETDGGAAYAATNGYDFLTTINAGDGFWVNAKTTFSTVLPAGAEVTSSSFKAMTAGWHLVSIGDITTPSGFNINLSATPPAAGTVPLNISTLWMWDSAQLKWYFYAPSLQAQGGTSLTDYISTNGYLDFTSANKTLEPGVGFWVNKP